MDRLNTQVKRVVRWMGWAVVCALVVSLGAWAPNALAQDALARSDGESDAYPWPEGGGPAEPSLEELANPNWSLAIDPSLLVAEEAGGAPAEGAPEEAAAPPRMPLPAHNLQGVGGGLITPMAYLINPGPPGTKVGLPSASYTFVKLSSKTAHVFAVTETLFRRIELGYAFSTLGLGNFVKDTMDFTGVDISLDHVMIHYFNLRGVLVEETPTMPAIVAGATFMYNPNVQTIDRRLGRGLRGLGFARNNGTDFTLTATKMFPTLFFGKPLIATAGIRFSQASQIGALGFGDTYRMTGEGSILMFLADNLILGYEYRQKKNPYGQLATVLGPEEDWHTVILAFCISPQCCVSVGWGHFGNIGNNDANRTWGFQFKYDF